MSHKYESYHFFTDIKLLSGTVVKMSNDSYDMRYMNYKIYLIIYYLIVHDNILIVFYILFTLHI